MAMGRPGFGPVGMFNSDPTSGDFNPGVGLSMLTRTNANAVQATQAQPTTGSSPLTTLSTSVMDHPFMWIGIAIGVLLIHKLISERSSDSHVADLRIGATNILVAPILIFVGVWFWRWTAGAAGAHGVPGATQVVSFFS